MRRKSAGAVGFCGDCFYRGATCAAQEASTRPRVTVATIDFPSSPLVSKVIVLAPWPFVICPTLTRHKKLIRGSPANSATKVNGSPARTEDGQLTLITGTWDRKISRA